METGEIIGLDLGVKTTGIARANLVAQLAEPLKSVPTKTLLDEVQAMKDLAAVVVGLPRNLSGSDTTQTTWVRDWVTKAKAQIDLPFYWQDEALTSVQAQGLKAKKTDEHALAASVILQDFLDSSPAERVLC